MKIIFDKFNTSIWYMYPVKNSMASKANGNQDDPGAFPAREWLRQLCVGKQVAFETR